MASTILIIVVCIIFSAFFSGTEIAFNTSNKLKIEVDKANNVFSGKLLSRFTKMPSNLIVTILLGNNVALVIYGIFAARLLTPWIEGWLPSFLMNDMVILTLQTFLATMVILIFAEFLPKILFRISPNKTISALAIPITIIYFILYPIVFIFLGISELILKRGFKLTLEEVKSDFTPTDVDHYINEFSPSKKEENEIQQEIQMVQNVMDMKNVKIRECMVPRTEIVAVDISCDLTDLQQKFIETGLSKILVYKNNIDRIIGYVHAFDLFKKPKKIREILRSIQIVPETMLASNLLKELIEKKRSIVVVVDEFGGTSGVITLEDLIEEIFGEIEDEFDTADSVERQIDDNRFIFSARAEIDKLNHDYNFELPESDEYETLSGLITHYHQSIPQKGEEIAIDNKFTFRILQASENRIEKVLMTIK